MASEGHKHGIRHWYPPTDDDWMQLSRRVFVVVAIIGVGVLFALIRTYPAARSAIITMGGCLFRATALMSLVGWITLWPYGSASADYPWLATGCWWGAVTLSLMSVFFLVALALIAVGVTHGVVR